jgi:hypothetical protein
MSARESGKTLKQLRIEICNPRVLNPAKLFFKSKGEIKASLDKQK